jgi:hypothetical protein
MKLTRLIVVLVGLLSLTGVLAGTASATTTVAECQGQLAMLRTNTVAAESSFTNSNDFDGLLRKLDAAAVKLTEGKNGDAVQKLTNFQDTLGLLAEPPKPKIDPAVAQVLIMGAPATGMPGSQDVIKCIEMIGTV